LLVPGNTSAIALDHTISFTSVTISGQMIRLPPKFAGALHQKLFASKPFLEIAAVIL
jgi:hypothetical protein